jgi:hypothetical protein
MSTTASRRRQVLSELSSTRRSAGRRSGWRIALYVLGGLAGLLLVLAGGAWYWWWSAVNDPRVVSIVEQSTQLRERFFPSSSQAGVSATMTEADANEMMAAMGSIREQMETLPEHLRPVAGMQIGQMFFTGMQQRVDDYFDTPPDQRQALLDQQIRQMEVMRAAFAQSGQGFGGPPGSTGTGGTGTQAAGAANGQGGPPWARGGNENSQNDWRKRMLDATSPEQRGKWTEYRDAIDKRRQELGLGDSWRG